MRILRIIPSIDPRAGGVVEGVMQLHRPLVNLGHCVDLLTCDSPDAHWVEERREHINIYAVGSIQHRYAYSSRLVPWLEANAANYDAVIIEGIWQYHSFATWRVLAASKVPYFVFTHGMLDPWFKKNYPVKHLKKWVYWLLAEYRVLRDARAVIFTCEEERLLARESFWPSKWHHVVSGYGTGAPPSNELELRRFFLETYPELRGKRIFLFLGRIHEKKGCDQLLDAFAKVSKLDSSLHLMMAGPDQTGWVAKLQKQAFRLGISDKVSWPGMLGGNLKWGAFYAAEVFCLPSHQENFGIVVAEALGCGRPVVISNKVNIWREIESDSAGIVHEDTLEGTLRGLQDWINVDVQERQRMSDAAKACFKRRFDIGQVAESLVRIISIDPKDVP